MNLKLSTCFVQVNDPDSALAFYRDGLGLELRHDDNDVVAGLLAKGALNGVH